jgi:hypothetical protein
VLLRAGQTNPDPDGGGGYTNASAIDATKGYEFTYYFQVTDIGKHAIYFGMDGAATETLSTGANDPYNYFQYYGQGEQAADAAAGKLVQGKWYKAVGYVLPKGAAAVPEANIGGIFEATTGVKIRDNKANLRWDDSVTTANVYSRMFTYYGEANQGYSTNFYKPEMREINSSAYLPGGFASVAGWQNKSEFVDETRWAKVAGPNGSQIVAIQAGQQDVSPEGGGNYTNEVTIDGQKAYQFIQYFKKTDLTKQYLFFGLDATGSPATAYVENAATGAADSNPYFLNFSPAQQQAALGLRLSPLVRWAAFMIR